MNLAPLLAPFRSIVEDPFDLPRAAAAEQPPVVGYTCSYLPSPLLSVGGLRSVRLRAPSAAGTPMADTYLSSVACPYVRALLERALEGGFDSLDGWVFAASCDHARRLHDNLVHLLRPSFSWIVDVPHRCDEHALAFYRDELGRLAARLADHFGVDTSGPALRAAMGEHNERLTLLAELRAHVGREGGALCGADFHTVMVASQMAPLEALRRPLEALLGELGRCEASRPTRARLLLVGSAVDDTGFVASLEAEGARVVADRHCAGSFPGLEPLALDGDPLDVLAETSLRSNRCPRMMDRFVDRASYVDAVARAHGVDGIVVVAMKFCDLWGVECALLVPALRSAGWPVLRLEREYVHGAEGQVRTRVQAFLESMGR